MFEINITKKERKTYTHKYERIDHPIEASEPIPFFRQLSNELTLMEIVVLGVVYNYGGVWPEGCELTNYKIAEMLNMTAQWVSNCMCRLRDKGVIRVELIGKEWRERRARKIYCLAKLDF